MLQDKVAIAIRVAFADVSSKSMVVSNIPSYRDMCNLMSTCEKGGAHGEDAIPGEGLALAPLIVAAIFHPVFLKATLRLEEPAVYRGGAIVQL